MFCAGVVSGGVGGVVVVLFVAEAFGQEAAGSGAVSGELVVGVGEGAGAQGQAAAADAVAEVVS